MTSRTTMAKTATHSLLAAFGLAAVVGFADFFGADEALIDALPDGIQNKVEHVLDIDGVTTGALVLASAAATMALRPKP